MKNYPTLEIDRSKCENEPIHLIGRIQSQGFMLVFEKKRFEVLQVSKNINQFLGVDTEHILNTPIHALLTPKSLKRLKQKQLMLGIQKEIRFLLDFWISEKDTHSFHACLYASDNLLILEVQHTHNHHNPYFFTTDLLNRTLLNFSQSHNIAILSKFLVEAVSILIDYDRVMIMQYDEEFNGNVIFESIKPNIQSFLNHHFPPNDIPKQAREMLKKKRRRYIDNVHSHSIELIPYINPKTKEPCNLLFSDLRNPSEIHLEYLKNMNVSSTLTLTIIVYGKVWGLIACQNDCQKTIDIETQQICEILANAYSQRLENLVVSINQEKLEKVQKIEQEIIRNFYQGSASELLPIFEKNLRKTLALTEANSLMVYYENEYLTYGNTPPKEFLNELLSWLDAKLEEDIFYTRQLSKLFPKAHDYKQYASGILVLRIARQTKDYIVWFKPEIIETIQWGGNPHKQEKHINSQLVVSPRTTFDSWEEKVRGRSQKWESYEVKIAEILKNDLLETVYITIARLQKLNIELKYSLEEQQQLNEELTSTEEELRQTYEVQKQILKQLSMSESQLKAIYNATTDIHFLLDKNYEILSFNTAAEESVWQVWNKQVKVGDNIKNYIVPATMGNFEKYFTAVWEKGEVIQTERKIYYPELQRSFFFKISYFPVYNQTGKIWAVSFNSIDLTAQKYAEEEVRKLALVAQNTDNMIIITDKDGLTEWVNEAFTTTTGYSLNEIKSQKPGQILQGKNTDPRTVCQIREDLNAVRKSQGEIINYSKTGREYWLEYDIQPVFDKTGNHINFIAIQSDISERKKIQKQIKESEKLYRLLADNSQDMICLHKPDGTYTYVSPSVKKLLGYEVNDLLDTNPYLLFHPNDIRKIKEESHEQILKNQKFSKIRYRIKTKYGYYVWFETVSQSLKNQEGNIVSLLTTSRDVSEEKHTYDMLESTNQMAKIGGWEIDLDTNQVFWTNEVYRIYQIPIGTPVNIQDGIHYYHPDYQSVISTAVEDLINTGADFDLELKFITAKKQEKWVRAQGSREILEGKANRIYGIFQDITRRKEAENEIQSMNERLTLATQAGEIGVWDWHIKENVLIWDNKMYEIYGLKPQKTANTYANWEKFLHNEDKDKTVQALNNALHNIAPFDTIFRIMTPQQKLKYIKASAKIIFNETQTPIRMIGINQDITAQKTIEKELFLAKERAEEMNRLKTYFLANMSHEIRTPINGILGLSEVIEMENENENIKEYIELQQQSGERLLNTITSILNLSRLEANKKAFTFSVVELNQLLGEVYQSLKQVAKNKEINFIYEESLDKLHCLAEESLLIQIFNNIVGNAIKFTKEGSVRIKLTQSKNIEVVISDTGIGISEEFLPKIFNSFEQESVGIKRKFEGSGLGLSIAKKYIELLGGNIKVKSQKGKGSEFMVQLPFYEEK